MWNCESICNIGPLQSSSYLNLLKEALGPKFVELLYNTSSYFVILDDFHQQSEDLLHVHENPFYFIIFAARPRILIPYSSIFYV